MIKTAENRAGEQKLRRLLKEEGYTLVKSRKRNFDFNNQGGYMVVDDRINACVGGARFDWDLDDVNEFVNGEYK